MGRVPSSYPRGVRRPTAPLFPILCLFFLLHSTSVCLIGLFVSCMSSLSFVLFLFVSLCFFLSRFRFPLPFLFMYCVNFLCVVHVFFLGFHFATLPQSFGPVCSLSFRFPLVLCT